jgi:uncharacterized SAM-binding protein YcdF (DUF218 family)
MAGKQQDSDGSKKQQILIAVLLVVFLLVSLHDKYLPFLGRYLIVNDKLNKSDAVFVFGGSIPNRIIEAVELYREGYSKLIIISKYPKPDGYDHINTLGISYPEGHDINRTIAVQMGVPENKIIIFPKRARSTLEEIVLLNEYLKSHNLTSVILVSTKSHTRRISLMFSDITGDDIKAYTRYANYDSYNPDLWWKDRNSLRQTLFEYQKIIYYLLVDRKEVNSRSR